MLEKKCQRCKENFNCSVNNIASCQCTTVELSEATKAFLSKTKYDCLCENCLQNLNNILLGLAKESTNRLIENKHYYMENGLMVFTETHHINRGKCCGSNCRHCAYGFQLELQKNTTQRFD